MAYILTDFMPLKMPVPMTREPAQISLINENMQILSGHDHSAGEGLPVAVLRSGLAANRPSAGEAGSFWFATNTGLASLDTGTGWVDFLTSAASGQTLTDPVVRDNIRFGPHASTNINATLRLTGPEALSLGNSPVLTQALGDARYLTIAGPHVTSVNGHTGVVTLVATDVGALSQSAGDSRYLNVTGDAMTGPLSISGKAVAPSGDAGNALEWRSNGFYMAGLEAYDVAVNTDPSLTSAEGPTNTFLIALRKDPAAGNALVVNPAGVFVPAQVNTALTVDTSLTVTNPSVNVFTLAARISPDANNALTARANGLYSAGGGAGTGLATDPLADVKGDVFAASANNAIGRLAVGTNNQVLTADSAQALGVKWADPTGITQAAADTRYVNVTGDQMSGALRVDAPISIKVAPEAWQANVAVLRLGDAASLYASANATGAYALLAANTLNDGSAKAIVTGAASLVMATGGGVQVQTAPSVAAGVAQTFTGRLYVDQPGNLALGTAAPVAWATTHRALQVGSGGAIWSDVSGAGGLYLSTNLYYNGTNRLAIATGASSELALEGNGLVYRFSPSATAGTTVANVTKMNIASPAGTLYMYPAANAWGIIVEGNTTAGQGYGVLVRAGTNTGDVAFQVSNSGAAKTFLSMNGLGKLTLTADIGQPAIDVPLGDGRGIGAQWLVANPIAPGTRTHPQDGMTWFHDAQYGTIQFWAHSFGFAPMFRFSNAYNGWDWISVDAYGRLILNPEQGAEHLQSKTGNLEVKASGNMAFNVVGTVFHPRPDNVVNLGYPSFRWAQAWITSGVTTGSAAELKNDHGMLDVNEALNEVLRVPIHRFAYKPTNRQVDEGWTEEERAANEAMWAEGDVYQQYERIGFMAEDAAVPEGDALLLVGPDGVEPNNTAGVLMAAIQALAARLTALEGKSV